MESCPATERHRHPLKPIPAPQLSTGDIRWLLLFCVARIAFSFIFIIYSAALPLLTVDWSMTSAQAGMIQSAWHLGYLFSLFAVGFLCDRFGAKRTFLWSAGAASVSALAFAAFSSGFVTGAVLYGIAGLCSGGSYTPGLTLIAERFAPSRRGRAMGIYLAAGSLAYALTMVLSNRLFPIGGWRLAFWVAGSLPTAGMALSLWVLRQTPNIIHATPTRQNMWHAVSGVMKNRPALLSMLAYTFHCWELLGMWAWLPAYLARAARTADAIGGQDARAVEIAVLLSGCTYLTSMLGSLIGGTLADRWGRSLSMLLFSCISLCCSFSFGWMLGWPLAVVFVAAAIYNLASIADSSIYSTALTELVEPEHIGAAYSLRSVMGFGAGAISPWVFGLILDLCRGASPGSDNLGWGLAWVSIGLGALPGPLAIWYLRRRPEAVRMAQGLR